MFLALLLTVNRETGTAKIGFVLKKKFRVVRSLFTAFNSIDHVVVVFTAYSR